MNELILRRARVLVGSHAGSTGTVVGPDDPRPQAHPQPGHLTWEMFMFFDSNGPFTGRPEDDGFGCGYSAEEVEFLD